MASISGTQKTWHKITLDFRSEQAFAERAETFRDYRLDVTFTNARTGEQIRVPGYFAADGDAADTQATSGNVWRANFNPPSEGQWSYAASFRTGDAIAASRGPSVGAATALEGATGSFVVGPTDKSGADFRAKGMILQDEGAHYLQHQGDGDYFIRTGPGVPENFLAYREFDNTTGGRHDYATHLDDYDGDGATWDGGKGKAILGAVNYIAGQGQNAIYVMLNTAGGDGRDVWPWAATDLDEQNINDPGVTSGERDRFSTYDVSKLAQWGLVFDHMDAKGLYKNILMQEQENDQLLNGGTDVAGTSLSAERLIYLREMVARFGHANGLQWNLGEESTNTAQERADMARWLEAVDPYGHLVVTHSYPADIDAVFRPLIGLDAFDGTSFQTSAQTIRARTIEFRDRSADAGDPWVLAWDEDSSGNGVIDAWSNNPDSGGERALREGLWGALTAGGSGANWYVKGSSGHSYDQNMDTFDAFESLWAWSAAAKDFFTRHIPFWDMTDRDELTPNGGDFVMADPGRFYVVYLPYGDARDARLDLRDYAGQSFDVFWYNPREGGDLISNGEIPGGAVRSIGNPPAEAGQDWVVLARDSALANQPNSPDPETPISDPDAPGPNEPETGPPTEARYDLVFSLRSDRREAADLANATLADDAFVFVEGTQGARSVVFYLDDPTGEGPAAQTERIHNHDFAGGADLAARAWDTTALRDGAHTITAAITDSVGSVHWITDRFVIGNDDI